MDTKVVLGLPNISSVGCEPFMLDMKCIGNLIICADMDECRVAALRQVVRGHYYDSTRRLIIKHALVARENILVWRLIGTTNIEYKHMRYVAPTDKGSIKQLFSDLADEYERRKTRTDSLPFTPLFFVIDDLGLVIKKVGIKAVKDLLGRFNYFDSEHYYGNKGIFLIAATDFDTLMKIPRKILGLSANVVMSCGVLTGERKRAAKQFFGNRMGDMLARGRQSLDEALLIDFINRPMPFLIHQGHFFGCRSTD